jgi:hypothetical protein
MSSVFAPPPKRLHDAHDSATAPESIAATAFELSVFMSISLLSVLCPYH